MANRGVSESAGCRRALCAATCAVAFGLACASDPGARDPVVSDRPRDDAYPALVWEGGFESAGARLNAIAYEAAGPGPHPTVILLHGFPGNERNLDLAQALRRGGWNVVFFHYRGAWGSGGDFGFGHALDDVIAVTRRVGSPDWSSEHRADPRRIALVGHSMGGMLAIAAAAELPEAVHCAVGLAAANLVGRVPPDPGAPDAARTAGYLDVAMQGRLEGTSGERLVGELVVARERFDLTARADELADRPLLLVAGARDRVVPESTAHDLAAAVTRAGGDARVVVLDADHAFSSKRIALARSVLAFLDDGCR